MKNARLLVLCLLAISVPGQSLAGWSLLTRFDDQTVVYADASLVRRDGNRALMPHLVRWGEPQVDPGLPPYLSTLVRTAYDCALKREKYLGSASYSDEMGGGVPLLVDEQEAEDWYSISEASMEEQLWRMACAAK